MNAFAFSALSALVALAGAAPPEPPARWSGQLRRELAPETRFLMTIPFDRAAGVELPEPVAAGVETFAVEIADIPNFPPMRVIWLQGAGEEASLYADLDRDGRFSAAERYTPTVIPEPPKVWGKPCNSTIVVPVALRESFFPSFPLVLCRPHEWLEGTREPQLLISLFAGASGTVEIGGRKLAVSYHVDLSTGRIALETTRHGLDGNGDGTIESGFGAIEWVQATGAIPVFAAGDVYVSTRAIDPESGRIELRSHPAADYVRAELKPGRELPDFAFTDLEGGKHRLSDFRGRHVLLDFWSVTCGPCIAEFPHLKAAYQTYRERGLEMVGMVMQDDKKKAAPFVARHELPWRQASWESIKDVAQNRFGILALPRVLLLDPQGKIVSTGEPGQLPLRGEGLVKTLEERLPARQEGPLP